LRQVYKETFVGFKPGVKAVAFARKNAYITGYELGPKIGIKQEGWFEGGGNSCKLQVRSSTE